MSTTDSTITRARPGSHRRGSDYAELLTRVRQAGLLDRRPASYTVMIAVNALLVITGWTVFVLLADSWWQLLTAAYLAVVFTRTGFLAHDAGHRQIFRSGRANQLVGLLHGNLAVGMAFGWWVDKHHRHHADPNTDRLIQAHLFFPMLLLGAVSLHVDSVRAVLRSSYRERGREALLLGLHAAAYLTAVMLVLSPVRALVFVIVQQGLFGVYLGGAFALNHKGVPVLTEDDDSDFLRRQVLTSRNVRGNWLVDFALGGLNYQIEHHLFPSMPRASLRRARPIIRAYCLERGLPYVETSLVDSYRHALGHLHAVGRSGRPVRTSAPATRHGVPAARHAVTGGRRAGQPER